MIRSPGLIGFVGNWRDSRREPSAAECIPQTFALEPPPPGVQSTCLLDRFNPFYTGLRMLSIYHTRYMTSVFFFNIYVQEKSNSSQSVSMKEHVTRVKFLQIFDESAAAKQIAVQYCAAFMCVTCGIRKSRGLIK